MPTPEYSPMLSEEEVAAVERQVDGGWVSPASESVSRFETGFSDYVGSSHAVAVDSGTAALHIALEGVDADGGEVIVQDYTYGATAMAAVNAGADPVLVDVERPTLGPDPAHIKEVVGPDTDAIIVAHMFGRVGEMEAITDIADDYGIPVIEDAAHALGAEHGGEMAGTLGDVGCFSFSWCKNMTTGKGGMVVTDKEDLAEKMESIADYGRDDRYEFVREGFNYQMDGIRAAIGCEQLEKLDEIIRRKRELFETYAGELDGIDGLSTMDVSGSHWSPYFFYLTTDRRDQLRSSLSGEDIATRPFYTPLHNTRMFSAFAGDRSFPVSSEFSSRVLGLPSHPHLEPRQQERVVEQINSFFK